MNSTHAIDTLTKESLAEMASLRVGPGLSIYQPTRRSHPENQQDPVRFRHLVKALEASLRQRYSAAEARVFLEPFDALAHDRGFWSHTLDGLAVLGAPGLFRVFLLQQPVAELAVVADSLHTKPLRQVLQSGGRYQVLAISLHRVQLFEGDRHALDAVALAADVPQTMMEAPGAESTLAHANPLHPGQGGRKDAIDVDAERFFRAVDRAVLEHHSRRSGLPLMLVTLPEHQHLFRRVSHNPFLMADGLMVSPEGLTRDELRQRAWEVAAPLHLAQQEAWRSDFEAAQAQGMGSADLAQVSRAAVAGRVGTLLIEAERQVGGRIDGTTGRIDPAELDNPRVDDVLDDLGALVERMGGQVHVLPAQGMPGRTGVAATFRH